VGYGDYFAKNTREKIFMLFLEFIGICAFSLITGNMTSLKHKKRIDVIIKQKVITNIAIIIHFIAR
jgi:hypothetical protein